MKKFLVIALTLCLGIQANAQLVGKAGFLHGTDKYRVYQGTTYNEMLNGFFAGAEYKIALPFLDGLGVAPGANLNFLFGKEGSDKLADIALQIPVYATYSYEITNDFRVYGFGGPSFQLGLVKSRSYSINGKTIREDNYANDNVTTFNRAMLLFGLGLGMEVAEMIQVSVGVDFGLTPFFRNDYQRISRPAQLKIGVGYLF